MFGVTGRLNVKQEEIDEMLKEAPGPINFTVFLTMFGEKLKGKITQAIYIYHKILSLVLNMLQEV